MCRWVVGLSDQDRPTPPIRTGFQDIEYWVESLPFTRHGSKHKAYISVGKEKEQPIYLQSSDGNHTRVTSLGKVAFPIKHSHLEFHMKLTVFILSFFKCSPRTRTSQTIYSAFVPFVLNLTHSINILE